MTNLQVESADNRATLTFVKLPSSLLKGNATRLLDMCSLSGLMKVEQVHFLLQACSVAPCHMPCKGHSERLGTCWKA